ncbi:MAG: hypothetical protein HYU64_00435 [Armatimonadetes bacterium]|nr:hypothetical protein [Armatimonadota bacterium]
MARVSAVIIALLLLVAPWAGLTPARAGQADLARFPLQTAKAQIKASQEHGELHFARGKLSSHFKKHGHEFGYRTPEEYLEGARKLALLPTGGPILRGKGARRSGDIITYNRGTNEFLVVSRKGIIRTYFKPDSKIHRYPTNLDYYDAQIRK